MKQVELQQTNFTQQLMDDIMIFQKPGTLENTMFPAFSVSNLLLV